jgi:tRNA threonylcarbamoyladenosine biosynthesis protein TsaB
MVVLALDTTTRAGSTALLVDGDVCHAVVGESERTHAERLPGELLALLARHGRALGDVERLAIVAGPGSFTGLRVGMAAMQGLAIARALPIVPVPTLEAMAQGLVWQTPAGDACTVVACLDAHRGEVFSAAWRVRGGAFVAGADVALEARVGPPHALVADAARLSPPVVVVLAGERAPEYAPLFDPAITRTSIRIPLAEVAARLAARFPERAVSPGALQPVYLRRPDAVLTRERAAAQGPPRG